jgi:hypothetical protein
VICNRGYATEAYPASAVKEAAAKSFPQTELESAAGSASKSGLVREALKAGEGVVGLALRPPGRFSCRAGG